MWRIVLGMSFVIALLVITMVLIAINETSTQRNADVLTRANESLQLELRCRAEPQLRYDKADAALSILIADTLANLSQLSGPELEERRQRVLLAVDEVRAALQARDESLETCAATADQ